MKNKLRCQHQWIALLGKKGKKIVTTSVFTCLKCGEMKVGEKTIRISRHRLDMGNKPIRNASHVIVNSRLRIPVGTNMFD